MSADPYSLLPAIYRLRDAQLAASQPLLTPAELAELAALQALTPPLSSDQQAQLDELLAKASRGPLQSLVMLIGEQIAGVAYDIEQLYDDQFIETCAKWVIPYIGDLIGYQSITGIAPSVDNPRSEVAETISLRRRKGTVLVIEQLARDVTAWGAHAVEMFRYLGDTQYAKHIRPRNYYAPDLRCWETGIYMDTGFDRTSHRVDVRAIAGRHGRYNIPNIGIFLWSLNAYSITGASPAAATSTGGALCYRFNALGMDIPLFHRAVSQGEQISAAAEPVNVPDRLRRRVLCADIQQGVGAQYYGPTNSLSVLLGGQLVNPYQIQVADLSGPDGSWLNAPQTNAYSVVIDPELGRMALPPPAAGSQPPELIVSYYYGFNTTMGGGEYSRGPFVVTDSARVLPYPDTATPTRYDTLQEALQYAATELATQGQLAIEFVATSTLTISGALSVDLPNGSTLELRAADGACVTVLLDGEFAVTGDAASTFVISGIVLGAGGGMSPASPSPLALVHLPSLRPDSTSNLLGQLSLTDCTLVPGWAVDPSGTPFYGTAPALFVEPESATVGVTRAILGSVLAPELATVTMCDSILDATGRTSVAYAALDGESGGGALTLIGCTVVGKVHSTLLTLVSNTIFWSALASADTWLSGLVADRQQEGCVRFSFLPMNAVIPRNFECVEQALASAQPIFFSLRYGAPAYMKLLVSTDDAIRRGASDGGEMGAYHWVLAPQRESDLNTRLLEYLPVGLQFGLIYQS